MTPQRFWHRPGRDHLGYFLLAGSVVGGWFGLVYGGADLLTAQHSYRVRLHLAADLAVPFVPAAVVVYMSIYLLFAAAPFVLSSRAELRALAATLASVIGVAGVCFVAFPGAIAFPPAGEL